MIGMRKPKVAAADFTAAMLPKNRKEVFFDVLKQRFWTLLGGSMALLVFSLPLQVAGFVFDMSTVTTYERVMAETITPEDAALTLITLQNTIALLDIVFYLIFAVGFAGVMRIIKRLGWEESVAFSQDFAIGVRQNGRSYAGLFLGFGVFHFLCVYAGNLSSLIGNTGIYPYLGIIPQALCLLFLLPVGGYMVSEMAIYDNRFSQHARLGLTLYLKSIPKTLLVLGLCSVPFLIRLIPNFYVSLIGRALPVFLLPFLLLAWFLFSCNILDQNVNQKHFPQLVDRGVLGKLASKEADPLTKVPL